MIQKTKGLLIQKFEDHNPAINRNLPLLNNASFIYLFQKFDEIYRQQTLKLKYLLKDKEANITYNSPEEKEAKKIIQELLRCEITISDLVKSQKVECEIPHSLAPLLEVLYEDFDLLPELLLTLVLKTNKQRSDGRGRFHFNILNFMTPFLEFFNEQRWNVVSITEKQDYLGFFERVFKEQCQEILKNDIKFSEEETCDFVQILEQNKNNNEELRKFFSKLCTNKAIFKEEAMYYRTLGRTSLILQLKSLSETREKLPINFLKISAISYLFSGKK